MSTARLLEIFLLPPQAIARVGGSPVPMPAYEWQEDRTPHGGNQTVIRPTTTFRVAADGSISAYLPDSISFKDEAGEVRPVAPFFELWGTFQSTSGKTEERAINLDCLAELGLSTADITFKVEAANRKAEARTGLASCAFIAWVDVRGDDHATKPLLATSPKTPEQAPLVFADKPIPLGTIQVVRPAAQPLSAVAKEVDLSVVRIRFTPAAGESYCPTSVDTSPASPLAPGDFVPASTDRGRIWPVAKPENRILNPDNPWLGFAWSNADNSPSTPVDSYDGAREAKNESLGVVDDTCDLLLTAELVWQGQRFQTQARAFAGPPDYAPDRRPFYSMADELADRDLGLAALDEETIELTKEEVADLFARIFETASLFNLDQHRNWATTGNSGIVGAKYPNQPGWDHDFVPKVGPSSMREADQPYANITPELTPGQPDSLFSRTGANDSTPYTQAVGTVHAPLAEPAILFDLLARRAPVLRELIRPPYAYTTDLPERPGLGQPSEMRDVRLAATGTYDMRMPPYMRHSMAMPLSLTMRQYTQLMDLLDHLEGQEVESDEG